MTETSDLSYPSVLQQQPVLGQEHQSSGGQVFHHVHGLGRQPTDNQLAILITNEQERSTDILILHQPLMQVNNQKSRHLGQGCGKDSTHKGSVSHHKP